jgi:ribosomal protein S8
MRLEAAFTAQGYIEGYKMAKKKKTVTDLMMQVRNTWKINPRTRVHESELKNKKKVREEGRKLVQKDDSGQE